MVRVPGAGRRVYGSAVSDSSAWQNTSRPLQAATMGGIVRVFNGSMTAMSGRMARWRMPVFACMSSRSKMAMPEHSLPVPAVVGTQIRGAMRPGTGRPSPMGGFTKVMKSAGYEA